MRIKSFSYFNKKTQLKIEKIEFGENNLLIGVSGAGKTQILNKLYELVEVANGGRSIEQIGSIKAEVAFEIDRQIFIWDIETNQNHEIMRENLYIEDKVYFTREPENIQLEELSLPAVSLQLSLLNVYKGYKEIKRLIEGLKSVFFMRDNRLEDFTRIDKSSIVLIDDFDHMLRIDNMEEIIQEIICTDHIQFIFISHHPYVINNIGMGWWKVIFRSGQSIITKKAEQLGIGKSRHDAFVQLMNIFQYRGELQNEF